MRISRLSIVVFAVACVLTGCHVHPRSLDKKGLFRYIKDVHNGLVQERTDNGIETRMSFQPSDLMALHEWEGAQAAGGTMQGGNAEAGGSGGKMPGGRAGGTMQGGEAQAAGSGAAKAGGGMTMEALRKKYDPFYYFVLKFSLNNKEPIRQASSFSVYSSLVQTLSFEMGKYVNLTTSDKDTVELADYVFDQTYGLTDGNSLILSFPRKKTNRSSTVYVNIAEFGLGTGNLSFAFRKQDLDNVPALNVAGSGATER